MKRIGLWVVILGLFFAASSARRVGATAELARRAAAS